MPRKIVVDYLARVEGEGALTIELEGDRAKSVELRIFEPPRLYEAFLRGRSYYETPDITARICGICPVAYQMSACQAMENLFGVTVDGQLRELRRLLYAGEWIESHALHIFMLHAPDFFGVADAFELAKVDRDLVKDGLQIKKTGNAIMRLLGGREIHPINVRVGGFYRVPSRQDLNTLLPELHHALALMKARTVALADLEIPSLSRDVEMVALRRPNEYAVLDGRLVSSRGIDISPSEYDDTFEEEHVARSNALHSRIRASRSSYLCGAMARINLNFDRLSSEARGTAKQVGFEAPCVNPFASILARCLEVIEALQQAIQIIEAYEPPDAPAVEYEVRPGTGYGITEAPRGALYHRYTIGEDGLIRDAKIVPPTSQNQLAIEEDLLALGPELAALPHDAATKRAEQAVRNYDPCISCATHFLKLRISRAKAPRVIALGYRMGGDDGVGPAVLDVLRQRGTDLELIEARDVADLIDLFLHDGTVVVVDALVAEERTPGSILLVDREELESVLVPSTHGMSVPQAIRLAETLHGDRFAKQLFILGVVIALPLELKPHPSPALGRAAETAADRIIELCR